ncbi:MAG: hypothetical protein IKD64_01285 [Lachnospiraceae bacterium]|nr:hypothetical protein [Lachnospiraceae bacterium]
MEKTALPRTGYAILEKPVINNPGDQTAFIFWIRGERITLSLDPEKIYRHNGKRFFSDDAYNSLFKYWLDDMGLICAMKFIPVEYGQINEMSRDRLMIGQQEYFLSKESEIYDFKTGRKTVPVIHSYILYRAEKEQGKMTIPFARVSNEEILIKNLGHSKWKKSDYSICDASIFENHFYLRDIKDAEPNDVVLPERYRQRMIIDYFDTIPFVSGFSEITIELIPPPRASNIVKAYSEDQCRIAVTKAVEGKINLIILFARGFADNQKQIFIEWDNEQKETFIIHS